MPDLAALRREYLAEGLREEELASDPLTQLESWLNLAIEQELTDATCMVVSTVSKDLEPSARVVLLKGIEDGKLIFFTRYSTRKGDDLANNSKICALFHYREFNRQVRVQGVAHKVSRELSALYWAKRPRASQLAASAVSGLDSTPSREALEELFAAENQRHDGQDVPLPKDWGGYAITPHELEFWQGRESRLHDRVVYRVAKSSGWDVVRLCP